jgi:hypothetical protein
MTGALPAAALQTALFDPTALTAVVTWDGTTGDPTDKAFVVLYDDESKRGVYAVEVARSAGAATLAAATLAAATFANVSSYSDVYAYLAFYHINPDGSGANSNTAVLKATPS